MRNGTIESVASCRWLASAFVRAFDHPLAPPTPALCVSILGTSYSGGWHIGMIGLEGAVSRLTLSRLESRSCIAGRLESSAVFVLFVRHGRAAVDGSGPLCWLLLEDVPFG